MLLLQHRTVKRSRPGVTGRLACRMNGGDRPSVTSVPYRWQAPPAARRGARPGDTLHVSQATDATWSILFSFVVRQWVDAAGEKWVRAKLSNHFRLHFAATDRIPTR